MSKQEWFSRVDATVKQQRLLNPKKSFICTSIKCNECPFNIPGDLCGCVTEEEKQWRIPNFLKLHVHQLYKDHMNELKNIEMIKNL